MSCGLMEPRSLAIFSGSMFLHCTTSTIPSEKHGGGSRFGWRWRDGWTGSGWRWRGTVFSFIVVCPLQCVELSAERCQLKFNSTFYTLYVLAKYFPKLLIQSRGACFSSLFLLHVICENICTVPWCKQTISQIETRPKQISLHNGQICPKWKCLH